MPLAAARGDSVIHEDSSGRKRIKVRLGTASAGEVGFDCQMLLRGQPQPEKVYMLGSSCIMM